MEFEYRLLFITLSVWKLYLFGGETRASTVMRVYLYKQERMRRIHFPTKLCIYIYSPRSMNNSGGIIIRSATHQGTQHDFPNHRLGDYQHQFRSYFVSACVKSSMRKQSGNTSPKMLPKTASLAL